MYIQSIISPECTLCQVDAPSKKKLLSIIADKVNELKPYMESQTIYNALLAREKLGGTGVGDKVAIPHCRIPGSVETTALLITLKSDIEYDAPDGKPVNLVFALLAPEDADDQHIELLNEIATLLNDRLRRDHLCAADSDTDLYFRFKELDEKVSA